MQLENFHINLANISMQNAQFQTMSPEFFNTSLYVLMFVNGSTLALGYFSAIDCSNL